MRYQALATDYDGTLARHGRVSERTIASLEALLATGRRLIMVTGRVLPELLSIFPHIELFEWVVAENGGLLYQPSTKSQKALAEPPPPQFLDALRQQNVAPMSVGTVIVATWEPHEPVVLETIRKLGLEWQVVFNKGAVMALPAGVNKASGLTAALKEMALSPHNVVAVGDAENDHAFLRCCEFSVAVANALPAVKETADMATAADHGDGVSELIAAILEDDLASYEHKLARRRLVLGESKDGEVLIPSYGSCVLVCGPSASGKSTLTTRLVESLDEQGYQFCLFDPEGDYENFAGAVCFGGPDASPAASEVMQLLGDPQSNAIINLTGLKIPDRPLLFLELLGPMLQMRTRSGRPHWLIMDEAHHLMPADWLPPQGVLPEDLVNFAMITVHPELLAATLLQRVDTLMVTGARAEEVVEMFCKAAGVHMPSMEPPDLQPGEVLLWSPTADEPPRTFKAYPGKTERRRHRRKYAEGELPPDRSFYFRGPEGKLKLRAQNLNMFMQLAEGVDDETWEYHLRNGDYAQWFQDCVKDEELAAAARQAASLEEVGPEDSREMIRAAIERGYIVMATSTLPVPGAS
jgi:hydroxymethylpyrimidine pyrophosphatase-like HAD family hydrolase/GTPase SAR1 family protein